jgi:hypothetical protein
LKKSDLGFTSASKKSFRHLGVVNFALPEGGGVILDDRRPNFLTEVIRLPSIPAAQNPYFSRRFSSKNAYSAPRVLIVFSYCVAVLYLFDLSAQ